MRSQYVLTAWLPPALWLAFIFVASTDAFSSDRTAGLLYAALAWLAPDLSERTLSLLHKGVRKGAHVFSYAVLSLLLFRAFRGARRRPERPAWKLKWAALALALSMATAVADEWHQTTQQRRSGTTRDVALDTSAAVLAQAGIYAHFRWRRRRRGEDPELEADLAASPARD